MSVLKESLTAELSDNQGKVGVPLATPTSMRELHY